MADKFIQQVLEAYDRKAQAVKETEAIYVKLLRQSRTLDDEIQAIRQDQNLLQAKYSVAEANKRLAHYNELVTAYEKVANQIDALVEERQALNGGK